MIDMNIFEYGVWSVSILLSFGLGVGVSYFFQQKQK
jgi:hypothetical protein|tara:strand:- start:6384 stop:6491 length:108 start_codon:yes stop_codon:yes gene_type:complete